MNNNANWHSAKITIHNPFQSQQFNAGMMLLQYLENSSNSPHIILWGLLNNLRCYITLYPLLSSSTIKLQMFSTHEVEGLNCSSHSIDKVQQSGEHYGP